MSTDQSDEKQKKNPARWQRGSSALAKRIFNADLPEQFIRTIPAQSLYCVLKHNGLSSSSDLLEIATVQQCRLMMDFDLWTGDTFKEESFWEWLAITDATDGLELLQKLFKCFDLKLVSLLIARYVTSEIHEEPSAESPGDGFFSPDKGHTWIHVHTDSEDRNFLLNRLLALIFETDADLFYQLLSIPGVATPTQLEEESYQDRTKRLSAEGVPEVEIAAELRAPLSLSQALKDCAEMPERPHAIDIFIVEPLIYDSPSAEPMERLFSVVKNREELEGELTFILNSAIVAWQIPFHEPTAVSFLVEQVKGAISIGLELVERESTHDTASIYSTLGLQRLFRVGYTQLMQLQRQAFRIHTDTLKAIADNDKELFAIIAGLRESFPTRCRSGANHTADATVIDEPLIQPFNRLLDLEAIKSALEKATPAEISSPA